MSFASNEPPASDLNERSKKARESILLIIDSDEVRAQNFACLLTLAGLRVLVTLNTYQAFHRFLQERFMPDVILVGQQEETTSTLFARFSQRVKQEFHREAPVIVLSFFPLDNGLILTAEKSISTSIHTISRRNSAILKKIWQVLPSARIPLKVAERTMVVTSLPKLGFIPRVTHTKRSFSSHLYYQLKAAKLVIPAEQWSVLLTDVGLARFCKEEHWPPCIDRFTIPPEDFALLTRAVMFSNPHQPIQQVYHWANQVEADALEKAMLIFIMQQIPKIIGADRTMRALLNVLVNEVDRRRGENLTEWKRLEDGSFVFVFYSNVFMYSLMGAEQPLCTMWQASFDLVLKLAKQQHRWAVREVECSGQTHTGHCIFLLSPKKNR